MPDSVAAIGGAKSLGITVMQHVQPPPPCNPEPAMFCCFLPFLPFSSVFRNVPSHHSHAQPQAGGGGGSSKLK
jgi:hypothetical protein